MRGYANDIRDGTLVKIRVEGAPARSQVLLMHAVHCKDALPGPAARALIAWLRRPEELKAELRTVATPQYRSPCSLPIPVTLWLINGAIRH